MLNLLTQIFRFISYSRRYLDGTKLATVPLVIGLEVEATLILACRTRRIASGYAGTGPQAPF